MQRPAPRPARLGAVVAAAAAGVLIAAAPAQAHVSLTPSTTAAGAYAVLELSVPHGCDGSATTAVTIQIPEEIPAVTPTRNASWTVEKESQQLDPPLTDSHGNEVTERVTTVTYTAKDPLPEGFRDVFELSVQLPDSEGDTVVLPTIQTCEQGESAWIQVPQEGQDEDELELPAPAFVLTAATGGGHHGEEAGGEEAGDDEAGGDKAGGDKACEEVAASADDVQRTSSVSRQADSGESGDLLPVLGLLAGLLGASLGGTALVLQRRRG